MHIPAPRCLAWALLLCLAAHLSAEDVGRSAKGQALLEDIRQKLTQPEAQRAVATCTLSEPATEPHRAHGHRPCDYLRHLTLRNPRVTYNLRYWMNTGTPEGADPEAIEGSSGLGMDQPSGENWYGNNFFEFTYGGKPLLKTRLAEFAVTQAEGDTARGEVRWQTPEATVTLELALPAGAVYLEVRCSVTANRNAAGSWPSNSRSAAEGMATRTVEPSPQGVLCTARLGGTLPPNPGRQAPLPGVTSRRKAPSPESAT